MKTFTKKNKCRIEHVIKRFRDGSELIINRDYWHGRDGNPCYGPAVVFYRIRTRRVELPYCIEKTETIFIYEKDIVELYIAEYADMLDDMFVSRVWD